MNKFTLPVFVVFAVTCGIDAIDTLLGVRAAYGPNNMVLTWAAKVDGSETSCYMFDGTSWFIYSSGTDVWPEIAVTDVPQCALTHDKVGRMMFA